MLHRRDFAVFMVCILGLFLPIGTSVARDHSFAALLKCLKQDYHLRPQLVPCVWFAKCVVKVIPTPGYSKIDFVLFGENGFRELATARDLNKQVQGMLGSGWSPFVQVDSSADKERTLIFARPSGRRMDLLILNCEPDETVAMFMRVNPKRMKGILDSVGRP